MQKFWMTLVASMFMFVAVLGAFPALAADASVDPGKVTVQLTDTQKKELATLHKEILDKKKQVISKYVEYGVIPQEKADKILSRLEKRYERIEQNGFIPQRGKCKRKHFQ